MRTKPLQVYLPPRVFDWLRREAAGQGVSLGEVVRRSLRCLMADAAARVPPAPDDPPPPWPVGDGS